MADERRYFVRGRFENIPAIIDFVGEAGRAAGLSEDEVFHCQMAVDEACTNVIEHAYGGDDLGDIELLCHIESGVCTLMISDSGKPFDPDSIPAPAIPNDINDIQPGGIGLHLMRQVMDEVSFRFVDGKNTLSMVKRHAGMGRPETKESSGVKLEDGLWEIMTATRLDAAASSSLESALSQAQQDAGNRVIVNMSGTEYVSSRGIKTLVAAWRKARDGGGRLVLASVRPNVMSVLDMVGLNQVFDIHTDPDEAKLALG